MNFVCSLKPFNRELGNFAEILIYANYAFYFILSFQRFKELKIHYAFSALIAYFLCLIFVADAPPQNAGKSAEFSSNCN